MPSIELTPSVGVKPTLSTGGGVGYRSGHNNDNRPTLDVTRLRVVDVRLWHDGVAYGIHNFIRLIKFGSSPSKREQ